MSDDPALTERKAPVEVEGLVEHVKDELRGQSGEEYTDAGMEDAFFRWPVIERALLSANKAGGLWYRRWFKAQVLNNELTAQVAELTTEVATLKQQLAEREEALRRISGLPKNYVGEQYKVAVLDIVGPALRALTRTDGGDQ